jgi:hypothetical protein
MLLSIVIVSWNTRDLLSGCLESIFREVEAKDLEVFVVDNASQDGSGEYLRRRYPQVKLIENQVNVGFARANNQALHKCSGQYIMLLNPDTKIFPGAFRDLTGFLSCHSDVGVVGPQVTNPDGTLQYSCSPAPTLTREMIRLLHLPGIRPDGYYSMDNWDLISPRQVEVLLGACILLRKEALDQVGFLDEEYFMYTEEVDLCKRLLKRGWKSFWIPTAKIIHYGGQSTQQVAQEMFLRLYESKLIYFRKHQGKMAGGFYKILLGFISLLRIFSAPFMVFRGRTQREKQWIIIDNYTKLLRSLPEM